MMGNPLTEDQIRQLNELSKLPPEEQKNKLNTLLKTFSPEQVAYLQQQQCVFCSLVSGKMPSKKIYEDDSLVAMLDIRPATKGHVIVVAKDHIQHSTELKDVGHFFNIVNKIVSKIYEVYKTGCNIFVANGVEAGQQVPHFIVHVIPRYENDGLQLRWDGKELSEDELDDVQKSLTLPKEEQTENIEEVETKPLEKKNTEDSAGEIERLP